MVIVYFIWLFECVVLKIKKLNSAIWFIVLNANSGPCNLLLISKICLTENDHHGR